jgi:hypothetical protein
MRERCVFFAGLLALCLYGCAGILSYTIEVEALGYPDSGRTSYVLLPANQDTDWEDTEYTEFAAYIDHALSQQGFQKAGEKEVPELAIFFGYGSGDPKKKTFTYHLPEPDQAGTPLSATTGSTTASANRTSVQGANSFTPPYDLVGSSPAPGQDAQRFGFMFLDAIDLLQYRQTGEAFPVWRTSVACAGASGDLQDVFPALVVAAKDLIARNPGRAVTKVLPKNAPEILALQEAVGGHAPEKK